MQTQLIPTVFHWVWIGPNPIPEKDLAWMATWGKHHPKWTLRIWAEHPENIDISGFSHPNVYVHGLFPLINQRFYDGIEQWVTGKAATASRSDIIRYEIMLFGGVYLDTDVECFGNIEQRLENVSLFVADEWGPSNGNYMFGATPNHPAIYTVVRELGPHLVAHKEALNACVATGPPYLNGKLQRYQDLVVFPHMLMNPLCAYDDHEQVTSWPAVSLANHHYDGKWYQRVKGPPPPEFRKATL